MQFTFFKSLSLAAIVALEAHAEIDWSDDVYDNYELAQLLDNTELPQSEETLTQTLSHSHSHGHAESHSHGHAESDSHGHAESHSHGHADADAHAHGHSHA